MSAVTRAAEDRRRPITPTKEGSVPSNKELTAEVTDELFWDPKVDNEAIAVSAADGGVTLRGTVGSLREKREAKKAAQRVKGVTSVENELNVRLLGDVGRIDAELRGDVLQALMLDSLIPHTVDAKVQDGYVTLTGEVSWAYQRDEADFVASNVAGALDVWNEIEISPPVNGADVENSITKALKRNAAFDADDLTVSTDGGTITIEGNVRSWAEHDEALDAAWAAPGVKSVHDLMTIAY
jgi:osmotically-inducible protein OsmY